MSDLLEAEAHQKRVIANLRQDGLGMDGKLQAKRHQAQASRILNAKPILQQVVQEPEACKGKAKGMLNGYAQKVAGEVMEDVHKSPEGLWSASVELDQPVREPVRATVQMAGKKAALQAAAFRVLTQLARNARLS